MTEKTKALVLLAQGNEEMEAVITIDVMRRAGIDVTVAGIDGPDPIRCSRGVVITPDAALEEVSGEYDIIVLPGGAEGAQRLGDAPAVGELLRNQEKAGRWVGAICAAPAALKQHGVFEGRRMTSHPTVRALLDDWAEYSEHSVVEDGNLITSRGPGTAFAFALRIVGALTDAERMVQVRAPMMFPVQVS
ncbi:MAG: DJ-1/PfpI family protein [Myxococcales bacterium]|nr:DJ-1/PfpI family protein [Myxococcales bacterium]MDH3484651.1 DJ-1/PfpI family protein [Myxococcales bacterium]